ncbi:hypothetical protein GDO78_003391 [Eleutherodactylus coqui]|uniref:Uncharacterized protein n=1 Tax=Eleutherodactylus coqui TaxID=57060 RepID=A0A8J6ETU5_ELECQ|nr:hypothetical protein GDO78_003391 [Eleutherodactylus coqui]
MLDVVLSPLQSRRLQILNGRCINTVLKTQVHHLSMILYIIYIYFCSQLRCIFFYILMARYSKKKCIKLKNQHKFHIPLGPLKKFFFFAKEGVTGLIYSCRRNRSPAISSYIMLLRIKSAVRIKKN